MSTATSTFKDVELVKTGTWMGLNGATTVTRDELAAAVNAQHDPEADRAPVKLGHVGGLALGDSLPAAGWVRDLKLRDNPDGTTSLLGNLADVPFKLAQIIPRAFSRRSIEMKRDVTTPSGRKHTAVVTGLALLGAHAPAVKGLADILDLYAGEPTQALEGTAVTITLGEDTGNIPHPDTADSDPDRDSTSTTQEDATMAKLDDAALAGLRKEHGLPETATEAEILAAIINKPTDDKAEDEGTGEQETPDAPAATETPAPETALGEGGPKVIQLSEQVWEQTQAKLARLEQAEQERQRTQAIEVALSEGRITPGERADWEAAFAKDPETITGLLKRLPARVNVVALGSSEDTAQAKAESDHHAKLLELAEAAGI